MNEQLKTLVEKMKQLSPSELRDIVLELLPALGEEEITNIIEAGAKQLGVEIEKEETAEGEQPTEGEQPAEGMTAEEAMTKAMGGENKEQEVNPEELEKAKMDFYSML